MKVLIILNDPPYGTERSYNGLRLAQQLARHDDVTLHVFLMADAVSCAKRAQSTPNGYYNLERMLRGIVQKGATVGACGTCMAARGLTADELVDDVHGSDMNELGAWTLAADKVIVF
jgi:uncharacterized protein involved in oxidation of intracellular sulfur